MPDIKIFVEINQATTGKVVICAENANKLGVSNGGSIEVFNPDNNRTTTGIIEISDMVLDFSGQVSKNITDEVGFAGVELVLRATSVGATLIPQPTSIPQPSLQAPAAHLPGQAPQPSYTPQPTQQFTPPPQPISTPSRPAQLAPPPQTTPQMMPPATARSMPGQIPQTIPGQAPTSMAGPSMGAPAAPVETYPNKIDVNMLQSQKNGIILRAVTDNSIQGGRVKVNASNLQSLGLGQGMLIAWEDPLTRATGSARIDQAMVGADEIRMSKDTKEDTHIKSDRIVVFSTEPPIKKASEIMLEVQSQPNLNGYCQVSSRTQHVLSIGQDSVLAFTDELTGAIGAGKVQVIETVPNNVIIIDSEILEASGIGSFEVKVSLNRRQIIPLQNIFLGISPISGENMWEIISTARQSVDSLKGWLSNYIIFKGIKLRWSAVNIACSIIDCVPDLSGDILAQVTPNTTLSLSPMGLIPFNAILIIDISRSMMARDVYVTNIAPAIEGIKAAMMSREIQEFLKKFKDGINIPRRIAAAFAAVLFLSEKVGRGFGEKVAVVRFADEAQVLPFGNTFYMDSASGMKNVLEDAARMIVDRIGNAYGQATNMGLAMLRAQEVLFEFERISPDQPTMIVILTDGVPTDGNQFFESIRLFSENPNVVIYLVGLGNTDDDLMARAASLCGGEYFKPEDAGELLVWYSKRARDLTVKLKAHKG